MMKNILMIIIVLAGILILFAVSIEKSSGIKIKSIDFEVKDDVWGIDVSHHQGDIDWDEVKRSEPSFVIAKATEGILHKDRKFKENIVSANRNGIPTGAYHFFSYRYPGKMQARHFLNFIGDAAYCMPLVLDVEYHSGMKRMKDVSGNILDFVNFVKERTGKYPIIYANCWYYEKYVEPVFKEAPVKWIASYTYEPNCLHTMHQSTDKFRLKGIKTYVDYNRFLGTKEEFNEIFFPCKVF